MCDLIVSDEIWSNLDLDEEQARCFGWTDPCNKLQATQVLNLMDETKTMMRRLRGAGGFGYGANRRLHRHRPCGLRGLCGRGCCRRGR
jgi:hypothetical protein